MRDISYHQLHDLNFGQLEVALSARVLLCLCNYSISELIAWFKICLDRAPG